MNRKKRNKIGLIFVFIIYSVVVLFFPFGYWGDDKVLLIKILNETGGHEIYLLAVFFFPVLFLSESFLIDLPFTITIKFFFVLQSLVFLSVIFILIFVIGSYHSFFGNSKTIEHNLIYYLLILFIISNIFFILWGFMLATSFGRFKIINWPFEINAERSKKWNERQRTKKEDEFKNRHRYR